MKKVHKKIAFNNARYLEKIVGDIVGMKRGRMMRKHSFSEKAEWHHYPRKVRTEVYKNNGPTYQPTNIKHTIVGMSDLQKSKLLRLIYKNEKDIAVKGGGRQRRMWGDYYTAKKPLCDFLFAKKAVA